MILILIIDAYDIKLYRAPTRTREMGKHFEQTGKVRENYTKYIVLENSGNLR